MAKILFDDNKRSIKLLSYSVKLGYFYLDEMKRALATIVRNFLFDHQWRKG